MYCTHEYVLYCTMYDIAWLQDTKMFLKCLAVENVLVLPNPSWYELYRSTEPFAKIFGVNYLVCQWFESLRRISFLLFHVFTHCTYVLTVIYSTYCTVL